MEPWVHTISQSKVYLTRVSLEYCAFIFPRNQIVFDQGLLCKRIFWGTKQREEGVWHEKMSPIQAFPWLQIGMVISKMLTFISPINSCISSHRESWKKMTKICMNPFEFSTLSATGEKSWRHFGIEWNPIFSLQYAFSFQQCLLPPLKTYHVGFAPAQQLSQWEWRSKEGGGNTGYWKVQILFFIASPINCIFA